MVAAAVVGAAVVGAAGSAIAGSEAAGATKDASNAAISQQQAALQQQSQLSAPYRGFGESAIPTLQSLLGISTPSAAPGRPQGYDPSSGATIKPGGGIGQAIPGNSAGGAFAGMLSSGNVGAPSQGMGPIGGSGLPVGAGGTAGTAPGAADPTATLRNMPGYQFAREQGLTAATNRASAMGMGLSGNTLEALTSYGTGLADQTYQQEVGNLENAVGVGQAAAAGQAANIGNAASNIGNTLMNQGNTLAGIDANTAAGITKSIGNAANNYQTLSGLSDPGSNNNASNWDTENPGYFQDFQSSDRRLKIDIHLVGQLISGLNVYTFRYREEPTVVHMGVMADEVEKVIPEAVLTDDSGYQRVCYGMLR